MLLYRIARVISHPIFFFEYVQNWLWVEPEEQNHGLGIEITVITKKKNENRTIWGEGASSFSKSYERKRATSIEERAGSPSLPHPIEFCPVQIRQYFSLKYFKDVSREFDEFRVYTHLCKLRCWCLQCTMWASFLNVRGLFFCSKIYTSIYRCFYFVAKLQGWIVTTF